MPTRKIPRNYRSVTGRVASRKTSSDDKTNAEQTSAAYESTLERDLLILLDFDPTVERFEEQPVSIEFTDSAGKRRTYTPDVLVTYRTDPVTGHTPTPMLAEIKYRQDLFANWRELKPKLKAGRAYARRKG